MKDKPASLIRLDLTPGEALAGWKANKDSCLYATDVDYGDLKSFVRKLEEAARAGFKAG
jgi:hypothetical protein